MDECTTFRLGGSCVARIDCATPDDLTKVIDSLGERGLPFVIIGWGSNLLVADKGIDQPVVRYLSADPLIREVDDTLMVAGSTRLDHLVQYAVSREIGNFIYCAGIPGTVGGAIAGNAGAFGRCLGDEIIEAEVTDIRTGKTRTVPADDLGFGYRCSALQKSGDILLNVRFRRFQESRQRLIDEFMRIISWRRERHPDSRITPCAGSFFRNIEPTSRAERRQAAGWYLAESGALEMRCGGAAVYDRHANIIIKAEPDCSAEDVLALSVRMAGAVRQQFGVKLLPEVRLVGFAHTALQAFE